MIKVNLLRNMGLVQGAGAADSGGAGASAVSVDARQDAIKKLLAIFIIPVALIAYEKTSVSDLETEMANLQNRLVEVQTERERFGDQGPRVEKHSKEKKKIEEETEIVKDIARVRLREVKSFDALQSLIPQRTWIKKVAISGNTVSLEGYSATDSGVSDFIRALENSVFFSRVEPKSTSQEMLRTGPVKRFELEFRVGKREQVNE
jgi:Tfp pilus assembly protein PilN